MIKKKQNLCTRKIAIVLAGIAAVSGLMGCSTGETTSTDTEEAAGTVSGVVEGAGADDVAGDIGPTINLPAEQDKPISLSLGKTMWYYSLSTGCTFGEDGIFDFDGQLIHFMDPASGYDSVICDRLECSHDSDDCPAYIGAMTYGIGWYDDSLLFLTELGSGQLGDLYLYESSTNGENRKRIAYFSNVQYITNCVFTEDAVVFSYYNQYDEELESTSEEDAGIIVYDIASGESQEIYHIKGPNARIVQMYCLQDTAGMGDCVCFSAIYYDLTEDQMLEHVSDDEYLDKFFCNDIDIIWTDMSKTANNAGDIVAVSSSYLFFYNSDGTYRYDINQGSRRLVGEEGDDGCLTDWDVTSFTSLCPSFLEDGTIILSHYDSDSQMNCYYSTYGNDDLSEIGVPDMTLLAAFDGRTYFIKYSDDFLSNTYGYMPTEDFLAGNFDSFVAFEE